MSRSSLRNFNQYHNFNERFDEKKNKEKTKKYYLLPQVLFFLTDRTSLQTDINDDDNANMKPNLFAKFIDQNFLDMTDDCNRHDQLDLLIHLIR